MHSDRSRCRAIDGHCLIWRAWQREQWWDNFIFSRSPPAPAATDNIIASEHFSRCTPSSCSVSTSSGCISTAPYISIPPFSSIDSFPFLSLLLHLIQALALSPCLYLDQCLSHRYHSLHLLLLLLFFRLKPALRSICFLRLNTREYDG